MGGGGEPCGIKIGGNGGDWESIAVSLWWLGLRDAFLKQVLVSPCEIFEISTEHSREEVDPRRKQAIGTTGNAGSHAATNLMVETIEGVIGTISLEEANAALGGERGNGGNSRA